MHNSAGDPRPREPDAVVIGVICGLLVAPTALGLSAAPVALPKLASDLHVNAGSTAWVLAGYSLTTAVLIALSGRLADLCGLRPPLVIATTVLTAGSALCIAAPNLGALIAGRLIQGVGAGAAGVISFRLPVARLTDNRERARALGTIGIMVGLVSGGGALLGGLLTDHLSWRWALALPGLSIVVTPAIAHYLPSHETRHPGRLDLPGALMCTLIVAGVTILIQAHNTGLNRPYAATSAIVTVSTTVLLARHLRRRPDGFLPRALVASSRFRLAAAVGFMLFAAYLIMQFAAPRLLLAHHQLDATQVGLILLPAAIASAALSHSAGALIPHTGPWPLALALTAGSTLGLLIASLASNSMLAIVIALAACVSGFSAGQVILMATLPGIVDTDIQGIATGVFQLVFITGGSVGAAAIGALASLMSLPASTALLAALPLTALILAALAARHEPEQQPVPPRT